MTNLKVKNLIFILLLMLGINMLFICQPVLAFSPETKTILIITSYEQNEHWESNILKGFYDTLNNENIKTLYKVENLAIANKDKAYIDAQAEVLSLKYKNTKFDLVVLLNDEALSFYGSYGASIFGDIPVVYGGVNNSGNISISPYNTYTGVIEYHNISPLMDLILNIHSDLKQINVLLDNSTFSTIMESNIKSSLAYWSTNVKFNFIKDDYIDNIAFKLKESSGSEVNLLVGNFKTKDNFLLSYNEVISKIKNYSKGATYTLNGGYLDSQVVGGYILCGKKHGETIGKLTLRVLSGEAPQSISPIYDTNGMFIFNYNELLKNKISKSVLPRNVVIKNEPNLTGGIIRTTIIALAILVIICIVVIIYQNIERLRNLTRIRYEKKRYEDVLEYDKMKTEFLANISHELRTPLNVMLSGLQLLEMHKLKGDIIFKDPNITETAFYIKQNGYRLLRLINNLIDVTKIDSGFFNLQLQTKNIVEVVENITMSIAEYIEEKGINLVFDTTEEEKYLSMDIDKIERIMLNLLSNAVKFTPKNGTILVNVDCCEDLVKIFVKDDGIGIPKSMQKTIFDRFTQVDSSLYRNKQGSGIGLSLVKSLAELHGGKIYVESEEGKGATFTLELPVTENLAYCEVAATTLEYDKSNYNEKIILEFSSIHESESL